VVSVEEAPEERESDFNVIFRNFFTKNYPVSGLFFQRRKEETSGTSVT